MRIAECGLRNFPAMKNEDLKLRTKQFALRVIRLSGAMPRTIAGDVLSRQIVRSATSVAANYRSACRAKSRADFIAKMGIVEEEADPKRPDDPNEGKKPRNPPPAPPPSAPPAPPPAGPRPGSGGGGPTTGK